MLASVNHPTIGELALNNRSGATATTGTAFLVMEFVDGKELAQQIDRGRCRSAIGDGAKRWSDESVHQCE